jgi:hypothetical protein
LRHDATVVIYILYLSAFFYCVVCHTLTAVHYQVLVTTPWPAPASRNRGVNQIDWSSEPPAPPQEESTLEEEYSPAHSREDVMLSFRTRPPVALPEGTVLLPNGTLKLPNATLLLTEYPDVASRTSALPSSGDGLVLPRGAKVYRNGSVAVGRHVIMTVFKNGFIPGCDGVSCHQYPLKMTY